MMLLNLHHQHICCVINLSEESHLYNTYNLFFKLFAVNVCLAHTQAHTLKLSIPVTHTVHTHKPTLNALPPPVGDLSPPGGQSTTRLCGPNRITYIWRELRKIAEEPHGIWSVNGNPTLDASYVSVLPPSLILNISIKMTLWSWSTYIKAVYDPQSENKFQP